MVTPSQEEPIFVRGLSRSGGTLMVTVLDAHPKVSMSYELYPTLLEGAGDAAAIRDFAMALRRAVTAKYAARLAPTKAMSTFVTRCMRSGLDHLDFASLLMGHLDAGLDFETQDRRLRFIERCALQKARTEGKPYWGLKSNNQYEDYLAVWPRARFLNMIRDGRDVLASQLALGTFGKSPSEVAQSWKNTHKRFRKFQEQADVRAVEVSYERLAHDPATELPRIAAAIGLNFDPAMLKHHESDLTVFNTNHLSLEQIKRPISANQISRWRKELSPEQVAEFEAVAGDALEEFGYERAVTC